MRRSVILAVILALAAVGLVGAPASAQTGELQVTFLAVGQSDAALYRGPCGEQGLVDAGAGDDDYVLAALDAGGSRTLEWMSVSHYDADHLGDIADIGRASGVTVGAVYDRGGDRTVKNTDTYRDYYDWVTAAGIRQPVDIGDTFSLCSGADQVTFTVTSAGTDGLAVGGVAVSEENDRGVCVHVEWGEFDLASCGDVNGTDTGSRTDVESAVAPLYGDVEVVKVSHHGSVYSSNATYVSTLSAEVAVISVGKNSFGHPAQEVIDRWEAAGADVFQTQTSAGAMLDGDVVVSTDGVGEFTVTTSASNVTRTYATDEAPARPAAQARAIDDSCPDGGVPEDGLADADGSVHEPAIDCAVWWQVASGTSPGAYSPTQAVTRAQMATFIANLITAAGGSLPDSPPDAFDDDDATTHEANINRLAAAGVVSGTGPRAYSPGRTVTRDQMATFLVRAFEHRTGTALASSADYFADDDGNAHEPNINAAAEAGFTGGLGAASYAPSTAVRRDAMASFLARVLDLHVERGDATTPSAPQPTAPSSCPTGASTASSSVGIAEIVADPAGDDLAFGGGEYVRLDNTGTAAVDVSYWALCDAADHLIVIPDGTTVGAGGSLYVHSGDGISTADRIFAGSGQAIWNNAGDTAELYDGSQGLVDTFIY